MSCPFCIENRPDYSYSGADIFGDEVQIPGKSRGLCYDTEYPRNYFPKLEIRVCEDCGAVWRMDYYFTDHPPLMIAGKVLKDPKEIAELIREIRTTMAENLKAGTIKQKEYDYYEESLKTLL